MRRKPGLDGLLLAALAGALIGSLVTFAFVKAAAPRGGPGSSPTPALLGAPVRPSPAVALQQPALVASTPASELIPAAFGGTATWCAPTPRYCQSWGRPAMLGAMESFRYGDKPYKVRVHHDGKHVDVLVVSYCACGRTLIDLSVAAFEKLAPLHVGRIRVTVEELGAVNPTLPATETTP